MEPWDAARHVKSLIFHGELAKLKAVTPSIQKDLISSQYGYQLAPYIMYIKKLKFHS